MMEPQEHKYDTVPAQQPADDCDESSTEVDESLMGDESRWHNDKTMGMMGHRSTKKASLRQKLASYRWVLDTSLLLVIFGLLVKDQLRTPPVNPYDFGGDITGFSPRFSQQITRFVPDQSYAPNDTSKFFTPEVLDRWNKLMPIGMGFQWVKNPEKYHDLPTPIEWPDKTVFTTSMTHQIHCLYAIVQTYSGLTSNHTIPPDHHWHMIHCFDYLRQTIMCCGDTALEGHETTFPDDNGGSDGWDSKHVCKDQAQVRSYLESVRAYDDQLIY